MSESGKAVFLSYASQDAEAAKRICEALRQAGVEVWFDQSELVGGDAWDAKIRGQIGSCALFVPIISANTQARLEGYFRLEWKLAAQRTHTMAEEKTFLLPVVIDSTRDAEGKVPAEFRAVQWTRLPGGEASARFVSCVQKLLGGPPAHVVARVADPGPIPASTRPATSKPRRSPLALSATVFAIVVAIGSAWFFSKKSERPAVAPPPSVPASPSPAPSAPDDKSIAVLPFENLSDDKDNTAFFSDGMHEDILTTLANIPDLRVTSRTSVMEYRNTTKKIPQIARELNVAYILEGSVRRSGNQIRLTGQLIRADKDEHLWAKSYDRELTPKEMFAIQAALATEIAGALQAVISPAAKKLVERRPTENLAAYDLYLRARSIPVWIGSPVREKLLQDAVELDPNFAEAWGELAYGHACSYYFNRDHTPERLAQADAAIARAVRLAPDSPEVIRMLGAYAYMGYSDYARAEAQYLKVLRLQPNNADAVRSLGRVQDLQGRWPEALGSYRKAAELDPGNLGLFISKLSAARRWDESIAVQQRNVAQKGNPSEKWKLAFDIFAATGSTLEIDEFVDRLTSAERDSAAFIPWQETRAIIRKDFAEWKRLDALPKNESANQLPSEHTIEAALVFAAHGDLAGARARLGSQPAQVRSALERQPANARLMESLVLMEAILGEKEAAWRDARKALEILSKAPDDLTPQQHRLFLAMAYALTGDKGSAVSELAGVLRVPSPSSSRFGSLMISVHTLRVAPAFANLRGDPAFEALLADPKNNQPLF